MSEEIIEDMLEEVAPQVAGDYPEIAQRYKAGEELSDEELDTIADVAISILAFHPFALRCRQLSYR